MKALHNLIFLCVFTDKPLECRVWGGFHICIWVPGEEELSMC